MYYDTYKDTAAEISLHNFHWTTLDKTQTILTNVVEYSPTNSVRTKNVKSISI